MGWTMSTWLNRGASGGLAGALKIERSNPQPIHLSQVKACSDERSRLSLPFSRGGMLAQQGRRPTATNALTTKPSQPGRSGCGGEGWTSRA
jgi:hypothetical protein